MVSLSTTRTVPTRTVPASTLYLECSSRWHLGRSRLPSSSGTWMPSRFPFSNTAAASSRWTWWSSSARESAGTRSRLRAPAGRGCSGSWTRRRRRARAACSASATRGVERPATSSAFGLSPSGASWSALRPAGHPGRLAVGDVGAVVDAAPEDDEVLREAGHDLLARRGVAAADELKAHLAYETVATLEGWAGSTATAQAAVLSAAARRATAEAVRRRARRAGGGRVRRRRVRRRRRLRGVRAGEGLRARAACGEDGPFGDDLAEFAPTRREPSSFALCRALAPDRGRSPSARDAVHERAAAARRRAPQRDGGLGARRAGLGDAWRVPRPDPLADTAPAAAAPSSPPPSRGAVPPPGGRGPHPPPMIHSPHPPPPGGAPNHQPLGAASDVEPERNDRLATRRPNGGPRRDPQVPYGAFGTAGSLAQSRVRCAGHDVVRRKNYFLTFRGSRAAIVAYRGHDVEQQSYVPTLPASRIRAPGLRSGHWLGLPPMPPGWPRSRPPRGQRNENQASSRHVGCVSGRSGTAARSPPRSTGCRRPCAKNAPGPAAVRVATLTADCAPPLIQSEAARGLLQPNGAILYNEQVGAADFFAARRTLWLVGV